MSQTRHSQRVDALDRRAFGVLPAPALVLAGILSVQLGAAIAKNLFAITGASGAVALRLFFAAVVLLLLWRPSLRVTRSALPVVIGYGVVLASMNISFYLAIARIPLGVAVTFEFLGPLTVSLLGAKRWLHALWAVLAAAGVVLLTGSVRIDWLGVGLAVLAGAFWGGYIMVTAALGKRTSDGSGLALAMSVAALVAVPVGLIGAGTSMLHPIALLAAFGVALLSSVVPYSVELEALRRIPPRVFGVLMSLEPAVAALIGLLVLGEALRPLQWLAICCVVAASIGATRTG